jgi:hypothetical protein
MEDIRDRIDGPLADALDVVEVTARELADANLAHQRAVSDAHRRGASLRQIARAAVYSTSRAYKLVGRGMPGEGGPEGATAAPAVRDVAPN